MSRVVTPGATMARNSASTRATSWFARRSLSISACERRTMPMFLLLRHPRAHAALAGHSHGSARRRRVVDHAVHFVGHLLLPLRAIHRPERRPGPVIVEHGARRPLVHLQPLEHHPSVV